MEKATYLTQREEEKNYILNTLNDYFKDKHEILFAYLFGSYAKGCENSLSDIDVAVYYSRDDISKDIDMYLNMRMELMELLKKDVDLVVLNTANPLLKSRIINNRVRILSKDTLVEGEFVSRSLGEYFDVAPYMEMQYQKAILQMEEGITDG